jgi:L-ascorbate metabolism protein UlaG (beta-lactamase superfamily)
MLASRFFGSCSLAVWLLRQPKWSMSKLHGTVVTWLGHATVLIQTAGGTNILIDPFIEHNPTYPKSFKLPKIDLLILTHGHGDHIGDAIPVAQKSLPTVLGIYELTAWLAGKGVQNTVGMNLGGSFVFRDVTATMVEAKHSSGIQDGDALIYGGTATGFVLTIQGGPKLYHAGDTCAFADMQIIRELYAPEFAMLPIGDHYTMGPKEAALAAQFVGAKTILPLHFGTFPALTGTPDQLKAALKQRGLADVEVILVRPGEAVA